MWNRESLLLLRGEQNEDQITNILPRTAPQTHLDECLPGLPLDKGPPGLPLTKLMAEPPADVFHENAFGVDTSFLAPVNPIEN